MILKYTPRPLFLIHSHINARSHPFKVTCSKGEKFDHSYFKHLIDHVHNGHPVYMKDIQSVFFVELYPSDKETFLKNFQTHLNSLILVDEDSVYNSLFIEIARKEAGLINEVF